MLEKLKAEILEKLERAKEDYKENSKISINAYGTGYEKGIVDSMSQLLDFIKELEEEAKEPTNFYERMIVEQKELMIRTGDLGTFMGSDKFKELDPMSQLLLQTQFNIMTAYIGVLSSRFFVIKAEEEEKEEELKRCSRKED